MDCRARSRDEPMDVLSEKSRAEVFLNVSMRIAVSSEPPRIGHGTLIIQPATLKQDISCLGTTLRQVYCHLVRSSTKFRTSVSYRCRESQDPKAQSTVVPMPQSRHLVVFRLRSL